MKRYTALVAGLIAIFATAMTLPIQSAFAATVNVDIVKNATNLTDKAFSPNPVNAAKGDTVTWTNKDTAAHTVTEGSATDGPKEGGFDSSLFGPNKTFSHTFADEGTFAYYCQVHPTMVGQVVVGAGGGSTGGNGTNGGAMQENEVQAEIGGNSYTVMSKSDKAHVLQATVMPDEKKVGVEFEDSGMVELTMPTALISGISAVTTSGGDDVTFQPVASNATHSTISFTLPDGETYVDVTGATVAPEFGVIAALVLAASLVAAIGFARVKGSSLGFGRF